MTFDEITNHDYIWAYMYGNPCGQDWTDQLIRIEISKLIFFEDGEGFAFIWGWPGPDMNIYNCEDYGKTWCFYRNEMPEVPVNEFDQKYADEEMN